MAATMDTASISSSPAKVYRSRQISEQALCALDEMRRHSQLCDVVIRVDNHDFVAHRAVLAATIPYFMAMFTVELAESKQNIITLREVEPEAIELLIQFVYTSSIEVREDNVQSLLPAANLLQLTEVRDICCEFLQEQLHPSNCLGIKNFADVHSCPDLFRKAQLFAQKYFSDVCNCEEFLNLPLSQVVELVSSSELGVLSEEHVFESVVAWIKHDLPDRSCHMATLMEHVRLPLLSSQYLTERVCSEPLIESCIQSKNYLIEAMKYHLLSPGERSKFASPRSLPRKRIGPPQFLLVIGGQAPKAIRNVEVFDIAKNVCSQGPELLSRRCRCGVAVLDGIVYAVGGFDGTSRVRSAEKLDQSEGQWVFMQPMLSRRSTLGVAILNNCLYAVGGFDGNSGLDSVEKYSPATDNWTMVASMNVRRSSVGVAAMQQYIYAIGGYDGAARQCLNSVERYNPTFDKWEIIEPMLQRRSGAAIAVVDDCLYAIGGHDGPDIRKSVEKYDPATGQWTRVADMLTCRRNAAAAVVHGLLYVTGGDDGTTNLSTVEVYDSFTGLWNYTAGILTQGRSYSGVAVIDQLVKLNELT